MIVMMALTVTTTMTAATLAVIHTHLGNDDDANDVNNHEDGVQSHRSCSDGDGDKMMMMKTKVAVVRHIPLLASTSIVSLPDEDGDDLDVDDDDDDDVNDDD